MIQNIGCLILGICTTEHLGFEIIAHINHGKAKSELDRQNFSALPKVMRLAHDLNFLLGFQMIKLSRSVVITAAVLDLWKQSWVEIKKSIKDRNEIYFAGRS